MIANGSQVDLIRSQNFESSGGKKASNVDAVSTPELDFSLNSHQGGVVDNIEEQVIVPTETGESNFNEITEPAGNEQQIIPKKLSVQLKVGDFVRTSEACEGIVEHDYGDGKVRIDFGDKILIFDASEVTVVEPVQQAQLQEPTFKRGQPVRSKKGFKDGVVRGFAKDGRLIVEWRMGRKQTQTELVDPADVN